MIRNGYSYFDMVNSPEAGVASMLLLFCWFICHNSRINGIVYILWEGTQQRAMTVADAAGIHLKLIQ